MSRCSKAVVAASLLVALAVGLAACGAPGAGGDRPPDVDRELLEALRQEADVAAARPFQAVRFNPAPEACQCPDFEVLVGTTWWRARLEPAADPLGPVARLRERAAAAHEAGHAPTWYVTGRLDDEPIVACANGCFGFELRVDAVSDTPPPLPEEVGP